MTIMKIKKAQLNQEYASVQLSDWVECQLKKRGFESNPDGTLKGTIIAEKFVTDSRYMTYTQTLEEDIL